MIIVSSKKLRDFYNEFFNNKYFRDIDYIRGKWGSFKDADPKDNTDRLRYGVKNLFNDAGDMSKFKKSARYFMLKKQHRDGHGQLVFSDRREDARERGIHTEAQG